MDCICITKVSLRGLSKSKFRANNLLLSDARVSCSSKSNFRPQAGRLAGLSTNISGTSKIVAKNNQELNIFALKTTSNFNIKTKNTLSGVIRSNLKSSPEINISYVEKLGGSLSDINNYVNSICIEKLYPTSDIIINSGNSYFVTQSFGTNNLYSNIDEGILSKQFDNKTTFIQPSSINSTGNFKYKFGISNLRTVPRNSLLLIQASAPLFNEFANVPSKYNIKNITLEDPSGNLIIKYKDFNILGDSNYDTDYVNWTTYITEPETNNAALNFWEPNFPVLSSGSISNTYKVNLDVEVECLGHQFTDGYDLGYESGCLYSGINNNNYSLRITAIELCNSGELFTHNANRVPLHTEVSPIGQRLTRQIFPDQLLLNDHTNNIYPSSDSLWQHLDPLGDTYNNTTTSGANVLAPLLRYPNGAIKLSYSSIADSGKLHLRFSHEPPPLQFGYRDGAFSFSTSTVKNSFPKHDMPFDMATWSRFSHDHFFTIDKIELKVLAKKASGGRNYSLDVVGYSDDKLLNVTSDVGGFLQNESGVQNGVIPQTSGFKNINELSIASEPLSHKSQYFAKNTSNNAGGDHYILSTQPVIDSTTFKEYTIPLKIYQDSVSIGKSTDYSISSYFEKLYLDIYPIPSGAEISRIYLLVYYKPENALHLHTIGCEESKPLLRRSNVLIPVDDFANSSGSLISNIPHAYTRDNTFKSNYSTRWKTVNNNVVVGPFDPLKFDIAFENPEMPTPFLNGYFSFNNDYAININNYKQAIIPDYSFNRNYLDCIVSGAYKGKYDNISNIGLRFKSNSLFNNAPTPYTTLDWTRAAGYSNHELYGKLTDNFENAVRVSGSLGRIEFNVLSGNNNLPLQSGFAIYTRFSPDINMSGVGYNLWNSGILFTNDYLTVGFSGGKIFGSYIDNNNNIITINDSKYYYEYEYPLPVMLSYNENDNKLRLYTNTLIGQSLPFIAKSQPVSTLSFGTSVNGFITSIGISSLVGPSGYVSTSGINILASGNLNKYLKQDLYSSINDNKLYSYIDDYVDHWHIGAFKLCKFNQAFDRFTVRSEFDYVVHNIKNSGLSYSNITNITLPSNINSFVCYHSQIENDSIRLSLSDSNTLSLPLVQTDVRISKTLPRGYQFEKEAIAVETIIEHDTNNNIIWDNGEIGPKLIVSLYTTNKEPSSYPNNYGLVTRHSHYLQPSGCLRKLISVFDFDNLIDDSEEWSVFSKNKYLNEFNHNYYSKDIDDMFLQYDLVYPSGKPFESSVKIHTANVRLNNAFTSVSGSNNALNLYSSGKAITFDSLKISLPKTKDFFDNDINLVTYGKLIDSGYNNLNIYVSGVTLSSELLPLHTITIGTINNINNTEEYLFGSSEPYKGLNLYCSGQFFEQQRLPIFIQNNVLDQSAASGLSLFVANIIPQVDIHNNNNINLYVKGFDGTSTIIRPNMNLYTEVTNIDNYASTFNLYTQTFEVLQNLVDESFNLFTVNVPILNVQLGNQAISWDSQNVGVNIRVDDNKYFTLKANDEIRGVELICYGDCK